jgi:hypothetical protein
VGVWVERADEGDPVVHHDRHDRRVRRGERRTAPTRDEGGAEDRRNLKETNNAKTQTFKKATGQARILHSCAARLGPQLHRSPARR